MVVVRGGWRGWGGSQSVIAKVYHLPPLPSVFIHIHTPTFSLLFPTLPPRFSDYLTTYSSQEKKFSGHSKLRMSLWFHNVSPPQGLIFKDTARRRRGLIQRDKSLRENSGTLTLKSAFLPTVFTLSLLNSSFIRLTFIELGLYWVLKIQRGRSTITA